MNIFYLDKNPINAARMLCDKHVVKMILETAQLLATTHYVCDGTVLEYKYTHINHPCTKWVRSSIHHYKWLILHGMELCSEYTKRYGKIHKTENLLKWLQNNEPKNISNAVFIDPPQAMPDKYKNKKSCVSAYRNYYLGEKLHFAKYKNGNIPRWIIHHINNAGIGELALPFVSKANA